MKSDKIWSWTHWPEAINHNRSLCHGDHCLLNPHNAPKTFLNNLQYFFSPNLPLLVKLQITTSIKTSKMMKNVDFFYMLTVKKQKKKHEFAGGNWQSEEDVEGDRNYSGSSFVIDSGVFVKLKVVLNGNQAHTDHSDELRVTVGGKDSEFLSKHKCSDRTLHITHTNWDISETNEPLGR